MRELVPVVQGLPVPRVWTPTTQSTHESAYLIIIDARPFLTRQLIWVNLNNYPTMTSYAQHERAPSFCSTYSAYDSVTIQNVESAEFYRITFPEYEPKDISKHLVKIYALTPFFPGSTQ
jgi:hypothetical protein